MNATPNLKILYATAAVGISAAMNVSGAFAGELLVGPEKTQTSIVIEKDDKAHDLLPARLKESGVVNIGYEANAGYPNSVSKGNQAYGLTVDTGRAIAEALGLKVNLVPSPFANLIPALGAERIDLAPALMSDTFERRKAVDFLDVAYSAGDTLVLVKSSPDDNLNLDGACGRTIGATNGSSQMKALAAQNKRCGEEGKTAIDVKLFGNSQETLLAVKSERVEASLFSTAFARFATKADPDSIKLGLSTRADRTGYVAIAFSKESDVLPAVKQAMVTLTKSGQWKQILDIYGNPHHELTADLIEQSPLDLSAVTSK